MIKFIRANIVWLEFSTFILNVVLTGFSWNALAQRGFTVNNTLMLVFVTIWTNAISAYLWYRKYDDLNIHERIDNLNDNAMKENKDKIRDKALRLQKRMDKKISTLKELKKNFIKKTSLAFLSVILTIGLIIFNFSMSGRSITMFEKIIEFDEYFLWYDFALDLFILVTAILILASTIIYYHPKNMKQTIIEIEEKFKLSMSKLEFE